MKLLSDILLEGSSRFGKRLAVADPLEQVTYSELAADASRLARALRAFKLEPGDRSLVVLPNGVGFVRAHFANLLAGLMSVPCDHAITTESLDLVCASCEPRSLLVDKAAFERLSAQKRIPACIRRVVVFSGEPSGVDPRALSLETAVREQSNELLDIGLNEHAVAALLYTTGTTGKPKGVQLTHANVLAALGSIVEFVRYTENDREVVTLPLSHNFGLGHLYCNLMSGGAVYTVQGLSRPGRVLKAIEEFGATGFPGTPLGIGMLMDKFGLVLAARGRNLRFSVINSAPLPPDRTRQLRELLPNLDVMVYYGLTEASRTSFISLSSAGDRYYRSVGCPMGHAVVEIQDDAGRALGAGTQGEVVVRGSAVTVGYWADENGTKDAFCGGWFRTGDLGILDADGFLWITGRIKDVINVGGYKVVPGDVESVLARVPGVIDVGVVGVSNLDGYQGESVVAALVISPDTQLDETALQQFCMAVLEKFKVPSRFVKVAEITRTNTGKIKRADLLKIVTSQIAANTRRES